MHEGLIRSADIKVEPIDERFRLIEAGKHVLFGFVSLRRFVEVVLAGAQKQGRTAKEQQFYGIFHSVRCFM